MRPRLIPAHCTLAEDRVRVSWLGRAGGMPRAGGGPDMCSGAVHAGDRGTRIRLQGRDRTRRISAYYTRLPSPPTDPTCMNEPVEFPQGARGPRCVNRSSMARDKSTVRIEFRNIAASHLRREHFRADDVPNVDATGSLTGRWGNGFHVTVSVPRLRQSSAHFSNRTFGPSLATELSRCEPVVSARLRRSA